MSSKHRRKEEDEPRASTSRSRRDEDDAQHDESSEYHKVLDKKRDAALIMALKHIDTFYKPPPELNQINYDEKPEDCIPDRPENAAARDFLAKSPTKGLWMPLGKEVKVMQCWRCKAYGHRSGDKECPMFFTGNKEMEEFRFSNEDPMHQYITETRMKEKEEKVKQLQSLLAESTIQTGQPFKKRKRSRSRSKSKKSKKSHKKVKKHKKEKHKSKDRKSK